MNRRAVLKAGAAFAGTAALAPTTLRAERAAINYWHTFTGQLEFGALTNTVMPMFAKAHPEVSLEQEPIPNSEFMAKMTAAVVSDSKPDTSMLASERFADLHAMGALTDITDRVESWERRGDFDDSRFASVTDSEGRIYGVPAFAFVDWMYYRKDWFEEAGIAPPTTMEEMRAAAIALTDPAKGRYGFGMRGAAGGQHYIGNILESFGSPVQRADGSVGLDRDKAIEAMDWYAGLYTRDKVAPESAPNDGFRQIMEAFKTGQTAMLWHHTGSLRSISEHLELGEEFATLPMPAGPAARVARLGYASHAITNERNADTAWEWLKFWGEPDVAVAFLDATGYFPASTAAANDERIVSNPIYAPAVETLGFGVPHPSFPGYAGWSENVALAAFQQILIGSATAEQAVDEMIAELDRAIN
ncbi:sugar ABC transporter substrate-binding protein [Marinovum sp.]|uniref:ABC transporter substrate-binding protein n=1 Tax=Marinovum sp. TaxID=2024839 RepID=UPI002B27B344|nr:sugar ABC transporter substrate-binding protein [Marinovum sp.]